MKGKGKYIDTAQNKLNPEAVGLIIGLFFCYLEYFLELRPKLAGVGLYELGFIDCLVVVLTTLLLIMFLKNYSCKGKKEQIDSP